jgi:hypothetical protein
MIHLQAQLVGFASLDRVLAAQLFGELHVCPGRAEIC